MNAHAPELHRDPSPEALPRAKRERLRPAIVAGGAVVLAGLAASALVNHRLARRAERDHPPIGRFLGVEGVRLHVLERGPADGDEAPLVLLHGNGAMIQDFLSSGLLDRAAERRRVIAFDRPGYGHSERPRGRPWTPDAQADLLAAALRQLGVERALVLGHSWGCLVAVALAHRHPGLVGGLVLESGYYYPSVRLDVVPMSLPAIPLLGDVLRHTVSPLLSRLMWPLLMRRMFGPAPVPPKFEGFPKELAVRPSQLRASAEESALQVPAAFAARHRYAALRVPVALVAGEADRMVATEAQSARLHGEVASSTLERVPGTGHMVHQTATDAVLAAVARVRAV